MLTTACGSSALQRCSRGARHILLSLAPNHFTRIFCEVIVLRKIMVQNHVCLYKRYSFRNLTYLICILRERKRCRRFYFLSHCRTLMLWKVNWNQSWAMLNSLSIYVRYAAQCYKSQPRRKSLGDYMPSLRRSLASLFGQRTQWRANWSHFWHLPGRLQST